MFCTSFCFEFVPLLLLQEIIFILSAHATDIVSVIAVTSSAKAHNHRRILTANPFSFMVKASLLQARLHGASGSNVIISVLLSSYRVDGKNVVMCPGVIMSQSVRPSIDDQTGWAAFEGVVSDLCDSFRNPDLPKMSAV